MAGQPEAQEDEVWTALEARGGYKMHSAFLVRAAGVEFARLGDRGAVRRRGAAVSVGLRSTEEASEELPPDACRLKSTPNALAQCMLRCVSVRHIAPCVGP